MPELELTPQPVAANTKRRWLPLGVFVVVMALAAVLLIQLIGDATLVFHETDDAVAQRDELGDRRFRLMGSPIGTTITEVDLEGQQAVVFTVCFNDVKADVVFTGNPPDLFQPGVPVVLDGRWVAGDVPSGGIDGGAGDGFYFSGDRMLVKHDNEYRTDRINDAGAGSCAGDAA